MPVDHIRYDILSQDALRGVVRTVLEDAARHGLPGEHHFFISFDTRAEGVKLSVRMREQYPEEMTVVLQHQFWDLVVTEDRFEVGLSFGGVAERVVVPFASILSFVDPSVKFGVQFQVLEETVDEAAVPAAMEIHDPARPPAEHKTAPALPLPTAADPAADQPANSAGPGAEVVRLDRFRKK